MIWLSGTCKIEWSLSREFGNDHGQNFALAARDRLPFINGWSTNLHPR